MRTATNLPLSRLPDRVLLARTRQLVDRERHLHVDIIDHLREIEDRDLHLARGFSTLFDYAVNELGYSSGAVWRRTLAMRLCRRMGDVRERLQTGSLTLSTAAQLQSAFERQERKRRRTWAPRPVRPSHGAAASTTESMAAQEGKATGRLRLETAASPPESASSVPAEMPVVVLDATGQRELVKQATGKSSRQVEELIASVDPSLATPREQLRARGDGRWTFTVVVDQECRHALNQLKSLMSHVDPAMSYGQLVNRLVQDELRRRDPRLRGSNRDDARPSPATDGSPAKETGPAKSGDPGRNGAATAKSAAATATATSASTPESGPARNDTSANTGATPEPADPVSAAKCAGPDDGFATSTPNQPGNGDAVRQQPASIGRAIPAAIKRAVWERDQGRCSYVDPATGRRCTSRHLLQIDHIRPWARGGGSEPHNLRLLCHAHHRHRHGGVGPRQSESEHGTGTPQALQVLPAGAKPVVLAES